jgi:hypothetical protein
VGTPSKKSSIKPSNAASRFLSQHDLASGVDMPRNKPKEANMPFLFWMPMIVMCGLWRAAEDDARTLFSPGATR